MEKYVVVFGGCSWDSTFKQRQDLSYPDVADIGLPGGKGANQAIAIARAGYNVKMISMLGDDEVGKKILQNLKDNNIDVSCVEILKGVKSDGAQLFVTLTGDNEIKRIRESIDHFNVEMINKYADVIKNAEYVVTQTKVPREVVEALIEFCYENKVKTIVTPCPAKGYDFEDENTRKLFEKITFITSNEQEMKDIMKNDDFEYCVDKLPNLIATAGPKGVNFCDEEGFFINIPAVEPRETKDSTGAGDTFCGNFLVALLNGFNKTQAVKMGVWAATLKLEHFGAQPGMPTSQELKDRTTDVVW